MFSFILCSCRKNNKEQNNNIIPVTVDTSEAYAIYDLDGKTVIKGGHFEPRSSFGTSISSVDDGTDWDPFLLYFETDGHVVQQVHASDIINAVNQKLEVQDLIENDGTRWAGINGFINGQWCRTDKHMNSLPDNYIKFTSADYVETVSGFKRFLVRGRFNVNLKIDGAVKNLSNGRFKLLMTESF